jgi:Nuclear pore component
MNFIDSTSSRQVCAVLNGNNVVVLDKSHQLRVIYHGAHQQDGAMSKDRELSSFKSVLLQCHPPFNVDIEQLAFNGKKTLLCCWGKRVCTILEISRRVRSELATAERAVASYRQSSGQSHDVENKSREEEEEEDDDDEIESVLCSTFAVGALFFETHPSVQIRSVRWQGSRLCLLSSDDALRIFNLSKSLSSPERVVALNRSDVVDFTVPESVDAAKTQASYVLGADGLIYRLSSTSSPSSRPLNPLGKRDSVGASLQRDARACGLLRVPMQARFGSDAPRVLVVSHRSGIFEVYISLDEGRSLSVLERLDLSFPEDAHSFTVPPPLMTWDATSDAGIYVHHALGVSRIRLRWLEVPGTDSTIELVINTRPYSTSPIAPIIGLALLPAPHHRLLTVTSNWHCDTVSTAAPSNWLDQSIVAESSHRPLDGQVGADQKEEDGDSNGSSDDDDDDHVAMATTTPFLHNLTAFAAKTPAPIARTRTMPSSASLAEQYEFLVAVQPEFNRHFNYLTQLDAETHQRIGVIESIDSENNARRIELRKFIKRLETHAKKQRIYREQLLKRQENAARCIELILTQLNRCHQTLSAAERNYHRELHTLRRYAANLQSVLDSLATQVNRIEQMPSIEVNQSIRTAPLPRQDQHAMASILEQEASLIVALQQEYQIAHQNIDSINE